MAHKRYRVISDKTGDKLETQYLERKGKLKATWDWVKPKASEPGTFRELIQNNVISGSFITLGALAGIFLIPNFAFYRLILQLVLAYGLTTILWMVHEVLHRVKYKDYDRQYKFSRQGRKRFFSTIVNIPDELPEEERLKHSYQIALNPYLVMFPFSIVLIILGAFIFIEELLMYDYTIGIALLVTGFSILAYHIYNYKLEVMPRKKKWLNAKLN